LVNLRTEIDTARIEFSADVARAARAWQSQPLLPLFSVTLAAAAELLGLFATGGAAGSLGSWWPIFNAALSGFLLLLQIGSWGTERVWYLRAYRHQMLPIQDLWRLSWKFVGRYVRLGLLVGWPYSVLLGAASHSQSQGQLPIWFWVSTNLLFIASDFVLTFATPALAYTTASARQALGISVRLIWKLWPRSAAYALVPPLALLLVARTNSLELNPALALAVTCLATLLNLLLKGATASLYIRRSGLSIHEPDELHRARASRTEHQKTPLRRSPQYELRGPHKPVQSNRR
jgi:hypothetical protein